MIERLIQFYQRSHAGSEAMMSGIWQGVTKLHEPLISKLLAGDAFGVESFLNTIGPSGGLHGLENEKTYDLGDSMCLPFVQKLANLTGVLPYCHPAQLSKSEHWKIKDLHTTIKEIESELGFELSVPDCFGFDSGRIPIRLLIYYCAPAFAIRKRLGLPRRTLEIGAGLGNLGMIVSRWKHGLPWRAESYTVIDLPHVAVLSAWFLSKCCGEGSVWLHGESPNADAFARIYSCTNYREAFGQYDLVFNSDSLPEMPEAVQDGYIRFIYECLSPGGIFFSVNHEGDQAGQSSVLEAVKRNGRLALVSRHPYAMLDGYVEEVYQHDL